MKGFSKIIFSAIIIFSGSQAFAQSAGIQTPEVTPEIQRAGDQGSSGPIAQKPDSQQPTPAPADQQQQPSPDTAKPAAPPQDQSGMPERGAPVNDVTDEAAQEPAKTDEVRGNFLFGEPESAEEQLKTAVTGFKPVFDRRPGYGLTFRVTVNGELETALRQPVYVYTWVAQTDEDRAGMDETGIGLNRVLFAVNPQHDNKPCLLIRIAVRDEQVARLIGKRVPVVIVGEQSPATTAPGATPSSGQSRLDGNVEGEVDPTFQRQKSLEKATQPKSQQ